MIKPEPGKQYLIQLLLDKKVKNLIYSEGTEVVATYKNNYFIIAPKGINLYVLPNECLIKREVVKKKR